MTGIPPTVTATLGPWVGSQGDYVPGPVTVPYTASGGAAPGSAFVVQVTLDWDPSNPWTEMHLTDPESVSPWDFSELSVIYDSDFPKPFVWTVGTYQWGLPPGGHSIGVAVNSQSADTVIYYIDTIIVTEPLQPTITATVDRPVTPVLTNPIVRFHAHAPAGRTIAGLHVRVVGTDIDETTVGLGTVDFDWIMSYDTPITTPGVYTVQAITSDSSEVYSNNGDWLNVATLTIVAPPTVTGSIDNRTVEIGVAPGIRLHVEANHDAINEYTVLVDGSISNNNSVVDQGPITSDPFSYYSPVVVQVPGTYSVAVTASYTNTNTTWGISLGTITVTAPTGVHGARDTSGFMFS